LIGETSGGSGGVNRYEELIDTEPFFGNDGKVPIVDEAEMKLKYTSLPDVSYLDKFPTPLVAGKILKVNAGATAYELVDAPVGANGYNDLFIYASPDAQEFTLATTTSLNLVLLNGSTILKKNIDWTQSGNLLTILPTVTLANDDEITAIGNV